MTKTCSKCKEEKDAGEFYRDRSAKSGLTSSCKKCAKAYNAEYIKSEAGKASRRASQKRYEAKPERQEANRLRAKKWAEANRERSRENTRKGIERGRAVVAKYAKDTGQELCVKCGTGQELEWDHIDPATKSFDIGGSYTKKEEALLAELAKCQRLCKPCHETKTAESNDKAKGRQRSTSGQ